MSLDTSLRTLTLQNPAVTTAIGSRYHIDNLPDIVSYPCVRALTITNPRLRSHAGTHGLRETVQLDVYSDVQTTRDSAAAAIVAWLDNYKGAMGSSGNVTIQVRSSPPSWEAESRLYRCMIELSILYLNN
jgi:hypothetical protein